MAEQTEDTIVVRGTGKVDMRVFAGFLGHGFSVDGDDVHLGIVTNENSIDLKMTKAEAKQIAELLRDASR